MGEKELRTTLHLVRLCRKESSGDSHCAHFIVDENQSESLYCAAKGEEERNRFRENSCRSRYDSGGRKE